MMPILVLLNWPLKLEMVPKLVIVPLLLSWPSSVLMVPPGLLVMVPVLSMVAWLLEMVPRLSMVPRLLMVPPGLLVMVPELNNIIPELIVTESGELTIRDDTVHVLPPPHVPDIGADSHDD